MKKLLVRSSQLVVFLFILILLPTTNSELTTVHADVKIGDFFGFGGITSLGGGTQLLINPIFSIATTLVIFYFLFGAFKFLKSAGNKEEVQGAREMMTQSIVGFIILIFAFLALQYIPQFFNLPGLDIIKQ